MRVAGALHFPALENLDVVGAFVGGCVWAALQIERTFKRTEDLKDADILIEWKVDVKACNPTCLPSLYFGKAK